jgi:hypothetical protein
MQNIPMSYSLFPIFPIPDIPYSRFPQSPFLQSLFPNHPLT